MLGYYARAQTPYKAGVNRGERQWCQGVVNSPKLACPVDQQLPVGSSGCLLLHWGLETCQRPVLNEGNS